MSDSVWPHRLQPTRLPRPWDSPGKNTGVGCHFLLQCMKVKSESEVSQSCLTLSDPMDCSLPGSSVHGIFPGKRTGVGCYYLLQCSCLENPRDGGAWWAAVYGVTQSRTRLMWLSSSSNMLIGTIILYIIWTMQANQKSFWSLFRLLNLVDTSQIFALAENYPMLNFKIWLNEFIN